MKLPRILTTSIAILTAASAFADTTADFDTAGTPAVATQSGPAPGPTVITELGNNFLRLISDGANGLANHYTFDATDFGGNWSTVTATYDFRIGGVDSNADGISFMLIPTSVYNTIGAGPTNFIAEEPNIANVFGIGHDVYLDNGISLHYDGVEHVNASPDANATINFANNVFNRTQVVLTQAGNGMNVVVNVTRDVFGTAPQTLQLINQAIAMQPVENRVQFSGRTGGLNMNGDIDNVKVVYGGTAAALPLASIIGRTFQDFDSSNTTRFYTHSTSAGKNKPNFEGPLIQPTGGSGGGAFLRLAKDSQGDTLTAVSLARGADSGLATARRVEVDFRMANPDGLPPADGLGIFLLPSSAYGNGTVPSIAYENPQLADTLAIGIPLYNNAVPGYNRVTLKWNNTEVGLVEVPPSSIDFLNNLWNRAQIDITPAEGGSNVTVTITPDVNTPGAVPLTIFDKQFIAGLTAYDFRLMAGARTGGATATVDVDRLTSTVLDTGSPTIHTVQNFDNLGTGYRASDVNGVTNFHPTIVSGGVSGNALRLAHAVNGQVPNIGFEKTIPDGPKARVVAEFDFKMNADDVAANIQRADGFQFALLSTNRYGNSGPIDENFHAYEGELLPEALSLGFRIYDNNIATSEDYIRFGYDGLEANATTFSAANFGANWFDLNSDAYHHVKLELTASDGFTLATLTLTPNLTGTPVVIFSDLPIGNLDLNTFSMREAFGARTGGLNTIVDLDNISLVTVPEPSTTLALLAGSAIVGLRRRRR